MTLAHIHTYAHTLTHIEYGHDAYTHTHLRTYTYTPTHIHLHILDTTPTRIHTCAHTHTHLRTYTHTHLRTYTYTPTHLHIYTHAHIHIHTYAPTHIHTCAHTHTHIRTYIPTRTYTYTPTHIHIYTPAHIHIHTYAPTHIHTCAHTHTHLRTYTYTHLRTYTYTPTHVHTYTHIHMHMYTCTHRHTRPHIHVRRGTPEPDTDTERASMCSPWRYCSTPPPPPHDGRVVRHHHGLIAFDDAHAREGALDGINDSLVHCNRPPLAPTLRDPEQYLHALAAHFSAADGGHHSAHLRPPLRLQLLRGRLVEHGFVEGKSLVHHAPEHRPVLLPPPVYRAHKLLTRVVFHGGSHTQIDARCSGVEGQVLIY